LTSFARLRPGAQRPQKEPDQKIARQARSYSGDEDIQNFIAGYDSSAS